MISSKNDQVLGRVKDRRWAGLVWAHKEMGWAWKFGGHPNLLSQGKGCSYPFKHFSLNEVDLGGLFFMVILFLFFFFRSIFLFASLLECPEGLELRCECESFQCCSCVPKETEICGDTMLLACTGEIMTRRCCTCIEECPFGFSSNFRRDCVLDCVLGNGTSLCCKCSPEDLEEEILVFCPENYLKVGIISCKEDEELECIHEDLFSDTACCRCNKIEETTEIKIPEDNNEEESSEDENESDQTSPESPKIGDSNDNDNKQVDDNDTEENLEINIEEENEILTTNSEEEISLESIICPTGFTRNLHTCASDKLLEIECINNQQSCCRCVPRKCPTGYIFHSTFQNCEVSKGWKNECQFFDSPYNNICCRCEPTTCPDPAYPSPDTDSTCPSGQVKKCDGNFSGGKTCCGCFQPECPSGDYSTSIRQCGIGYKKECKGFHDRKRCCRCVPKQCEEGYRAEVKVCQVGYKTCSGYSGESSCCRCNTGAFQKDGKTIESFCPDGYVDIDLFNYNLQNNQNEQENENTNEVEEDKKISFCGVGEYTSCLSQNSIEKESLRRRSVENDDDDENNNNSNNINGTDLEDWEDYSSCCKCEKICPEGYSTRKLTDCADSSSDCVAPVDNFMSAFLPENKSSSKSSSHGLRIEDSKFCCRCVSSF